MSHTDIRSAAFNPWAAQAASILNIDFLSPELGGEYDRLIFFSNFHLALWNKTKVDTERLITKGLRHNVSS